MSTEMFHYNQKQCSINSNVKIVRICKSIKAMFRSVVNICVSLSVE